MRSLVVGELDDRDRRRRRPDDHGRIDGQLDLGPAQAGQGQQEQEDETDGRLAGRAQAARPSSASAVMM
jgi:hypothetical protein